MSDTVKKYYEMVEDGTINPDSKIPEPKTAYTILTRYDIEDIKEAVRIYEEELSK